MLFDHIVEILAGFCVGFFPSTMLAISLYLMEVHSCIIFFFFLYQFSIEQLFSPPQLANVYMCTNLYDCCSLVAICAIWWESLDLPRACSQTIRHHQSACEIAWSYLITYKHTCTKDLEVHIYQKHILFAGLNNGKKRHWDPARIQTGVFWIPVRYSYQLRHWNSQCLFFFAIIYNCK